MKDNKALALEKTILFLDMRHIRCGDLEWLSSEGNRLPVAGPPEPEVIAYASTGFLPHGIKLVAQKAKKTELLPKGPRGGRIIFENGLYRSWYLQVDYPPGRNFGAYSTDLPVSVAIGYSESKDGFEWVEKSSCPIEASGQSGFDGFTFFIDSNPNATSDERYKIVYMAIPPESERASLWEEYRKTHPRYRDVRLSDKRIACIYGVVSPDGLFWKAIRKPLIVHWSDTDTSVYYDSWLGRYVMYTRLYNFERRWVGRAESEDFYHFGPVQPLIWPTLDGALYDDIYTNGRTEYPGCPNYHLMFPMVYHRYDQTSEVRLFSSVDGICWHQVPGGAVISPGEAGEWDSEFIHAGKDLVPLADDRFGVPYHGTSFPHKYPRWKSVLSAGRSAWVWWSKGRLCAVEASEEGAFFTFPLTPAGRELRLNVRTKRSGEVRVGILGVSNRSVNDCDPIFGDGFSIPVHWKGETDIGAKEGERAALHFRLRSAELFGLEWV